MKILLCPDKFKGSLSGQEVCEAITKGLQKTHPTATIISHPMADGGDGSIEILSSHISLQKHSIEIADPLIRKITSSYYTSSDAAFIELASASGLVLLEESERNPLHTSTLGTGEMVLDAITKGYQKIYLFLGGSATNDGGIGIATALGFQFLDRSNKQLSPIGASLPFIHKIDNEEHFDFRKLDITLLCDVQNPLCGFNGAAHIYAPQKGASPEQVLFLDNGLKHYAELLKHYTGKDLSEEPGIGAAGGIGAGLVALCGAQMAKGFELIAQLTDLEKKIAAADWVISGEGKLDEQSLQGKVVDGIAQLCQQHQKPLTLFVGKNDLSEKALLALNIKHVFSIMDNAKDTKDAMSNGKKYLTALAKDFKFDSP